jgi:hypothetical protein
LLTQIAAIWVDSDPEAALAAIETIGGSVEQPLFAQVVLNRIGQTDPERALAFLERLAVPDNQKMGMVQGAIQRLAARDPERALNYAQGLGGQIGQLAEQAAVQMWAQQDAPAAIAYLETMPLGMLRQNLLQAAAHAYGRSDPEAALAWARSLGPADRQAYSIVLSGIAQVDPMRALDLVFDQSQQPGSGAVQLQALMGVLGVARSSDPDQLGAIADRVMALPNGPERQNALQMLGQRWASTAPDDAMNWLISRQEALGANVLSSMAQELARRNPRTAAAYADRVLPVFRDDWITAVAGGYAQSDTAAAQAWLQQYRGQPVFEPAVAAMVRNSAGMDPAGAAALLQTLNPSSEAVTELAAVVASAWAGQDWAAAQNWTAALPAGQGRDRALSGMLRARHDMPDPSFMALFSSEPQRQQAISTVITQVAQFDGSRARDLARQHIDDPRERQQLEQAIENIESSQGSNIGIARGIGPVFDSRGAILVR